MLAFRHVSLIPIQYMYIGLCDMCHLINKEIIYC